MKTRPIIALLLVMAMAASMVACQSPTPAPSVAPATAAPTTAESAAPTASPTATPEAGLAKYDPPITITVAGMEKSAGTNYPEGMDPFKNPWIDAYLSELGINFEYKWIVPESKFDEKMNTQIAAGDEPDLMYNLGWSPFDQLKKLGMALPLDDLISANCTELAKKVLNSDGGYSLVCSRGDDGKLYALPNVGGYMDTAAVMWIRSDWLKKVNGKVPTTMDELSTLVEKFVKEDPDGNGADDTLGFTTDMYLDSASVCFSAYGAQPFWSWYKDTDGIYKYSTVYNPEGMKKGLDFMQKLYAAGLMDPEFGTVDYGKHEELIISGKVGVTFKPRWFGEATLYKNLLDNPNAMWEAHVVPTGMSDSPSKPFAYCGPAGYTVVSTKCAKPEAIMKMFNLFCEKAYGPDAAANCSAYIMDKNGFSIKNFALVRADMANDTTIYNNVANAVEKKDASSLTIEEKIHYDACMKYIDGDVNSWAQYITYGPKNPTISVIRYYIDNKLPMISDYYGPTTEAIKQYQGDLDAKWLQISTQIIMGQKPVSAYDDFVTQWYELGGSKMQQELNDYIKDHPQVENLKKLS